jgi:hypothetical protein
VGSASFILISFPFSFAFFFLFFFFGISVTQDDLIMETQTCRELLMFSANLRLPKNTPHAVKVAKVGP